MSDACRTVSVFVRDIYAGTLEDINEGFRFTYAEGYLKREDASPVSLTLPLRSDPFTSKTMFPFFDGLIPEGWLLDIVTRNWKIDRNDRFGLLAVACRDCIGAVSIKGDRQ
jgi:serine/threonine-protein kinase HipA